jgi:hypothetical protein
LIPRVWHLDPLRYPVCQSPKRVIAVIGDPRVVGRILRHLGAWHDPPASRSVGARRPAGLSAPGTAGPYTYEPCDTDPMADYENVPTD